jgi:FAD binding domain/D-arabinono-1,4-lactone oxidase
MPSAPGAAMSNQKLFIVRTTAPFLDVYERFWNGNEWVWESHGRPQNLPVRSAPGAAMADDKFFVIVDDGSLWERHWRSDLRRWVWNGHGRPENKRLRFDPGAAMLGEKLFVVTEHGELWERQWRADLERWAWENHGRPGNEVIAFSPGAAMMNEKLFVVTAAGNLWERHWRADLKRWAWEEHGKPPGTTAASAPGAAMLNRRLFVTGANGRLFERSWTNTAWVWVDHGTPPGTTVRPRAAVALNDTSLFVSTTDGRLFQRSLNGSTWAWVDHRSPAGTTVSTAPGAAMLSARVFVGTSNEHLFERYWNGRSWAWIDHGTLEEPTLHIQHEHWENWLADFHHFGMKAKPRDKDELMAVIEWAVKEGLPVRAVGSGHSHSSCGRPRQAFVDISAIAGPFDRVDWLKGNPPGLASGEKLLRVKAGTTVKALNRLHLHTLNPPLGLINMGTFDGQTLAGAISTGTHGTGMRLGSLADMVVSMDIATVSRKADGSPDVQCRRIEPSNGVTDRAAFERDRRKHGMLLEQSDDLFHAMVVSFGCMGIVYAYTLRVRDEYWLKEETECVEWPLLSSRLGATTTLPGVGPVPTLADSARHVWFMVNVAEMQGANKTGSPACFLITRDIAEAMARPDHWHEAWPPERKSDFWKEVAQDWGGLDPTKQHDGIGKQIRNNFIKTDVGRPAFQGDHWRSVSYIAHRREQEDEKDTAPPEPPPFALSIEVAVPATDIGTAVNTAIECVERSPFFFISPWGVRFSSASNHYLSPAYGRASAWLEVVFALPTPLFHPKEKMARVREEIAKPELAKIETALCYQDTLHGRPHLGKHNTVTRARLERLFPKFDAWLAAYRRFNAFGTFDNAFTDQLGLTGVR